MYYVFFCSLLSAHCQINRKGRGGGRGEVEYEWVLTFPTLAAPRHSFFGSYLLFSLTPGAAYPTFSTSYPAPTSPPSLCVISHPNTHSLRPPPPPLPSTSPSSSRTAGGSRRAPTYPNHDVRTDRHLLSICILTPVFALLRSQSVNFFTFVKCEALPLLLWVVHRKRIKTPRIPKRFTVSTP